MILMFLLFYRGHLQEVVNVYEDSRQEGHETTIQFMKWELAALELNRWIYCSQGRCAPQADYAAAFGGIAPAISVYDINSDGWMDLTLTTPGQGKGLRIFLNEAGRGLREITEEVNLDTENIKDKISVVGWALLGEPRTTHMVLGLWGCMRIFEWSKEKMRFEAPKVVENERCGRTQGLNIADVNGNGRNDILTANFSKGTGFVEPKEVQIYGDKEGGERNQIIGFDGTGFSVKDFSNDSDYSWGVGLSYVNDDLIPDALVTNDFSTDALYMVGDDWSFKDVTADWLDYSHHGYSGMNTEFGDFDGDGDMDIYISNIYSQPFYTVGNNLWLRHGDRFVYGSDQFSVRKCGWSWAAKFEDFNRDGSKDLLVGNGRYFGGKEEESIESVRSYWYYWINERMTPIAFRSRLMKMDFFGLDNKADFSMAGREKSCLFEKGADGKVRDVATQAGLDFVRVTRAMALVDINNDGLKDVVFGNFGRGYDIYLNRSEVSGGWLGVAFQSQNYGRNPHGVRVMLYKGTERLQVEELFPFNGLRAQSDHRLIFPIPSGDRTGYSVSVLWPSGRREIFTDFKWDSYNTLKEGDGDSSKN